MKEGNYDGLTVGGRRITSIVNTLGSDQLAVPTDFAVSQAIAAAVIASGSNIGEVYNVRNYGAVPNAVIPVSGNTVTGTDNKTAFDACIAAAPAGARVYIGTGNWLCSSLAAISSKKLLLECDGVIYTNGQTWLTINAPGGRDRHHQIVVNGKIVGKINYPGHTKTNYDNNVTGTTYWDTMTGSAILINQNVNGVFVRINEPEGFKAGIEMVAGGGNGSQENTFEIIKHTHVRYPIYLRSTDGFSWCDKNVFQGWGGGTSRLSCEVPIKIDGFETSTGGAFNGAFRSNKFISFLIEGASRVCELNGDITESKFDITVEGGSGGVFDPTNAIQCRSVSPNFVRAPKWEGQGVLTSNWMTHGMGIDGTINMSVWQGPGSTAFIGTRGKINSSGIVCMEVRPSLSSTIRNALLPYIKCVDELTPP